MIRFLHAADIHLDSPLRGLAAYEGAPVATLRTATRGAFTRLIDTAIDQAVDFLIIAGDLYDGDWRDYNTGLYFCREIGRLHRANIPVFMLFGNHDAESEITRRLPLPPNVRVFSARLAETFRLDDLRVALHGQSYQKPDMQDNLVPGYPDPLPGWFNIGVLHTAIEGSSQHARYAPTTLAELRMRGYDYWALGHVHERAVLSQAPWVVFPGNLQGRHIRECGPRGAVLVSVEGDRVEVRPQIVDVLRWHHLLFDVGEKATWEQVVDAVGETLCACVETESDGRPMAVRVTLTGRTAAHAELFSLETQLRNALLARALGSGVADDALWLERVVIDTLPTGDSATRSALGDALADLQSYLDEAPADPALQQEIADALRELIARTPEELRRTIEALEQVRQGDIEPLIRRVVPGLLARIAADT